MTTNKVVRSTNNPGVKQVVKLRNARERRESGLFCIEGFRELKRAIDGKVKIERLYFCPELYLGEHEDELVVAAASRGAETIEVSREPFEKMSYRDRPEGLLAVAEQFDTSLERIKLSATPLVLVVERIEKPGNLGTMIRAAGAAGVDVVIVADPTTDVFNPNVVRSSIGTSFIVPIAVTSTDDAITWLREHDVKIVATTPHTDVPHWDAPLAGPVAVVVGSEQYGLSITWLGENDVEVKIPMPGDAVDSLNASASAAVLLFEAVRQRSAPNTT
jgi:TrmH family RNA methyltransferase